VYNEDDLPNMFLQVQNEVVGSPIFLMQLCKNNRHIEVQIVGDEHGNAGKLLQLLDVCASTRTFVSHVSASDPIIRSGLFRSRLFYSASLPENLRRGASRSRSSVDV
jgi:hypothetical protein